MLKLIPEWVKFIAAAVLAICLCGPLIHYLGKREGKAEKSAELEVQAAKEALKRIDNLEKNNASFRNLDARHRCLVFARDSRLPESTCDE